MEFSVLLCMCGLQQKYNWKHEGAGGQAHITVHTWEMSRKGAFAEIHIILWSFQK